MKVYSSLDLINKSLKSNLLNKLFEFRYVTLPIELPSYEILRAKVLIDDIVEMVEEEGDEEIYITVEDLIVIFFRDFLRQIRSGTDLYAVSSVLKNKMFDQQEADGKIERKVKRITNHYWSIENRKRKNKSQSTILYVRLPRTLALRGEVFLHDLHKLDHGLRMNLEKLIAIRFRDVLNEVKSGNDKVIKAITENFY